MEALGKETESRGFFCLHPCTLGGNIRGNSHANCTAQRVFRFPRKVSLAGQVKLLRIRERTSGRT